jgi:hypothetical protein
MELHKVQLVTRDIGDGAEVVIAVLVDGHRLELGEDEQIAVFYTAGTGTPIVHIPVLAGTVRHIPEDQVPK